MDTVLLSMSNDLTLIWSYTCLYGRTRPYFATLISHESCINMGYLYKNGWTEQNSITKASHSTFLSLNILIFNTILQTLNPKTIST